MTSKKEIDSVIDIEKKKAFIDLLEEEHGGLYAAASKLAIPMSKIRKWRNEDAEFDAAVNEVTDTEVRWVEYKLHDLIEQGNVTATTFFLRTKGKSYGYQESQKVEAEVKGQVDVEKILEDMAMQVDGFPD